jgi:hypothetical protein
MEQEDCGRGVKGRRSVTSVERSGVLDDTLLLPTGPRHGGPPGAGVGPARAPPPEYGRRRKRRIVPKRRESGESPPTRFPQMRLIPTLDAWARQAAAKSDRRAAGDRPAL